MAEIATNSDNQAFFEEVEKDPTNPFFEKLRMVQEIFDSGARTIWYFLVGITYGDVNRKKYERKMEAGTFRATWLVAYATGAELKPLRDQVLANLISAGTVAILAALGIPSTGK